MSRRNGTILRSQLRKSGSPKEPGLDPKARLQNVEEISKASQDEEEEAEDPNHQQQEHRSLWNSPHEANHQIFKSLETHLLKVANQATAGGEKLTTTFMTPELGYYYPAYVERRARYLRSKYSKQSPLEQVGSHSKLLLQEDFRLRSPRLGGDWRPLIKWIFTFV